MENERNSFRLEFLATLTVIAAKFVPLIFMCTYIAQNVDNKGIDQWSLRCYTYYIASVSLVY